LNITELPKDNHSNHGIQIMNVYEIDLVISCCQVIKDEAVKAWTLSANDMFDDDVDVLDSDDVLDDLDLKKPDPATLKGGY